MKLTLKQTRLVIVVTTLVILAGGFGYWLGSHHFLLGWKDNQPRVIIERNLPPEKQTVNFSLFWKVWDRLAASYFDKTALKPKEMVYGAIKGMVAALGDPYTVFLPPKENKEAKEDLGGSFEGIGIQLGYRNGNLAVIAPLAGMPAERAGVKAGDLILKIEDRETTDISLPEAVRLIRGPRGTTIKLTFLHEGETQPYEVLITRETIIVPSVELKFERGVAHLKLMRFGERTNEEWNQAVSEIVSRCQPQPTAECRGVVLDLRNNPGGYLSGSVFIASEFLPAGVVVRQEYASGRQETFSVNRAGRLTDLPLVVLVNKGSASASEILAGALKEYHRAKIVGEPTFGKGTIQEAQDLEGGAGLHVTTARWLLPSGKSIDKKGIVPDYQLEDNPETEIDEQFEKALEVLS
ncbi:MAG: S41 family peptidase [Alphaproteobacteria bacterium]